MSAGTSFFQSLPKWAQLIIAGGIAATLPMATYIYMERNGTLSTKGDVLDVKNAVHQLSEDQVNKVAEFAARQRSDHDSARYAAMFDTISAALIAPGIKRLRAVEDAVHQLNDRVGISNDLLQEQNDVNKDTRSRVSLLQQQLNSADPGTLPDKLQALLAQQAALLAQMKAQAAAIDTLKHQRNTRVHL